jgi:hypothetical protein
MISSRTPEGDRNNCPICGASLRLEQSAPTRDGPCPQCGHLLWFARSGSSAPRDFQQARQTAVLQILEARFGLLPPEAETAVAALGEQLGWEQTLERILSATSLTELLAGQ